MTAKKVEELKSKSGLQHLRITAEPQNDEPKEGATRLSGRVSTRKTNREISGVSFIFVNIFISSVFSYFLFFWVH